MSGNSSATTRDAATYVQAYDDAWNRHDVDAVMAYFGDDATVRLLPPPPPPIPGLYSGKEQIRQGFVETFIRGFQVQSANFRGDGTRLSWSWTAKADVFRQMGADPATGTGELVLQGDTVKEFSVTLSAETLEKIQAAMRDPGQPDRPASSDAARPHGL